MNTATAITIRPCEKTDFEAVMDLLRQLWPGQDLNVQQMRAVYERARVSGVQTLMCAEDQGRVVGFGCLSIGDSLWQMGCLAHVDELVVDGAYRGQGVGSRLLEHMEALARQRGCRRIDLDSAFHRTKAHEFYRRRHYENRACLFSKLLDQA